MAEIASQSGGRLTPAQVLSLAERGSAALPQLVPAGGNKVDFVDGDVAGEQAALDVILSARHVLDVSMFLWGGKGAGERLGQALIEQARRGVEVNVIVDGVGSMPFPLSSRARLFNRMREAGIRIRFNRRVTLQDGVRPVDHRKIFIADGRRALISSMNLSSLSSGWREAALLVQGPAASQAAATQLARWVDEGGSVSERQRAAIVGGATAPLQGRSAVAMLQNDPGREMPATQQLHAMINGARRRLYIKTPWLTDPAVVEALKHAAQRGVDVRVMLARPDHWIGSRMLDLLNRSHYEDLVRAGVAVLEQPEMSHAKIVLADNLLNMGSLNMSERATMWNFELNAATNDPGAVRDVARVFEEDSARSRVILLGESRHPLTRAMRWLRESVNLRY